MEKTRKRGGCRPGSRNKTIFELGEQAREGIIKRVTNEASDYLTH